MRKMFCRRPFEWLEIQGRDAYLCCSGWIDFPGIPVAENTDIDQVWNSTLAQTFRESILDGSFKYCSATECPFLTDENIPHWEPQGNPVSSVQKVSAIELREVIDQHKVKLDFGPKIWNCGHDSTCNLSCPSCRPSVLALNKGKVGREIDFQNHILTQISTSLKTLYITGAGDPFSSQVYRALLREVSVDKYPHIDVHLHTNGLLWTPANWQPIKSNVTSAHISIDAGSPETYAINRRGGNWDTLIENLEFISQLRKSKQLEYVMISFVVQKNNYQEMPAFVELGEQYGFDLILFTPIRNWGTFTATEFHDLHIASENHIDYQRLQNILIKDCFDNDKVSLGRLALVREQALSNYLDTTYVDRIHKLLRWYREKYFYAIKDVARQHMPNLYSLVLRMKKVKWH